MFVEFPGASGPVFVNADCIAQISVGGPQSSMGTFFHEVRVTFKGGYEHLIDNYLVDYDYMPHWKREVREVLGIPLGVPTETEGEE